jgi:hypothetical protein
VLELGVPSHVEVGKVLPGDLGAGTVADRLHAFKLHLVACQEERLGFWKFADFLDVLLPE